jgi:ketosteroid isomerase-like protein
VTEDAETVIRQLEERRMKALVSKDWHALSSLLSDDLVHVHANGAVEDKASYLATMATRFEILKVERPSFDVRVLGESAIVTGPLKQLVRIIQTGETVEMHAVATQIWVKQRDGWAQCGFQATRVS